MEAHLDEEGAYNKAKQNFVDDLLEVFCPCARRSRTDCQAAPRGSKVLTAEKEKERGTEASGKLLEVLPLEVTRDPEDLHPHPHPPPAPAGPPSPGALYRARPSPSAPVIDECCQGPDGVVFTEAHLAVHRQYSQPVQATT